MGLLTINGIEVPALTDGLQMQAPEEGGVRGRSVRGTLYIAARYRKHRLVCITPPLVQADAFALRGLLAGLGDVWSFDAGLYSSKGRAAAPSTATVTTSVFGGQYAGHMQITSAAGSGWVALPFPMPNVADHGWTVIASVKLGGTTWSRIAVRSDGLHFWDGFNSGTADVTWLMQVAAQGAYIQRSATVAHFDDVVVLPYVVPSEWAFALTHPGTGPMSPLPRLNCSGDLLAYTIRPGTVQMVGRVGDADFVRVQKGGPPEWRQRIAIELEEC